MLSDPTDSLASTPRDLSVEAEAAPILDAHDPPAAAHAEQLTVESDFLNNADPVALLPTEQTAENAQRLASDDFSIPGLGSTMIRAEASSPRGDMTNGSVSMQEPAAVRDALHDIVVQNAKLRQEAAHGGLDLAGIEERVDAVLTDEVRAAFMQTLQNARDEMDKARELDRSAEEFLQTVLVDEAALLKSPGGSTPPTAPKAMRQQPSGQSDVLLSPTRTRLRRSPSLQSNGSYPQQRRSPSRHRSPEYERERRYREHSREQPRRDHSKDRYRSLDREKERSRDRSREPYHSRERDERYRDRSYDSRYKYRSPAPTYDDRYHKSPRYRSQHRDLPQSHRQSQSQSHSHFGSPSRPPSLPRAYSPHRRSHDHDREDVEMYGPDIPPPPLTAVDHNFPVPAPTQQTEDYALTVPGVWAFCASGPTADVLECSFTLDKDTAAQWNVYDPEGAPRAEYTKKQLHLQLYCVPLMAARGEGMSNVQIEWPKKGLFIVEVNRGTSVGRMFVPDHEKPLPVNITHAVQKGLNIVRFIQLVGMESAFIIHASEETVPILDTTLP